MVRLSPEPKFESHKGMSACGEQKQVKKAARANLSLTKILVRGRDSHGISCKIPSPTPEIISSRVLFREITERTECTPLPKGAWGWGRIREEDIMRRTIGPRACELQEEFTLREMGIKIVED